MFARNVKQNCLQLTQQFLVNNINIVGNVENISIIINYKDKYRQQHQQQQKTPEYKSYQYKYYRLCKSGLINYYRDKTIETSHTYSEKDFTVCL